MSVSDALLTFSMIAGCWAAGGLLTVFVQSWWEKRREKKLGAATMFFNVSPYDTDGNYSPVRMTTMGKQSPPPTAEQPEFYRSIRTKLVDNKRALSNSWAIKLLDEIERQRTIIESLEKQTWMAQT